jgi:hypothetical protein
MADICGALDYCGIIGEQHGTWSAKDSTYTRQLSVNCWIVCSLSVLWILLQHIAASVLRFWHNPRWNR